MAVERDPDTGQFVSSETKQTGGRFIDTKQVMSTMHLEVPAADLGGGTTTVTWENDNALELVDFGDILDQDQAFEVVEMYQDLYLAPHTTATAEGHATVGWTVSNDLAGPQVGQIDPPFFSGSVNISGTAVDRTKADSSHDGVLDLGLLSGEASFGDSTNGLGAGSNYETEHRKKEFGRDYAQGPLYDADDSLYFTGETYVDNISDHAVTWGTSALFRGQVHDLD